MDTNTTVSRWQSNTEEEEWFQVDMGEGASFDAVDIQWYSNGEDYDLLISDDGTEWNTLEMNTDVYSTPLSTSSRNFRAISILFSLCT